MDFIKEWVELLNRLTDANKSLKEASGLFVISSIIGHKAIIPSTTDSKIFSEGLELTGKRLNLWFLIIGKSRWSRKSTVLSYVDDYLRTISNDLIASTIATPEALVDELSENPHKAWIMDEFGIILEACKRKDYMADITGLLQKLYDGRTFTRRTRGRGRITISNPYFTVIASTTPFSIRERLINDSLFIHGFLNRFLILWDEGVEKVVPIGERLIKIEDEAVKEKRDKLIEFGKYLYKVNNVLILEPTKEVRDYLSILEKRLSTRMSGDEIINLYTGNIADFILRISGIYRLSRLNKEELEKPIITIEGEDYRRAYKFIQNFVIPSLRKLVEEIRKAKTIKPKEIRDISGLMEIVKSIVERHGKKEGNVYIIDRKTLYRYWNARTGAGKKELDNIINEFQELGEVESFNVPTGRKPRIVYHFRM